MNKFGKQFNPLISLLNFTPVSDSIFRKDDVTLTGDETTEKIDLMDSHTDIIFIIYFLCELSSSKERSEMWFYSDTQ